MPESAKPQATQTSKQHQHEGSDVDVRRIFIVTVIMLMVVIVAVLIAGLMNYKLGGGRSGESISRNIPPPPRLQSHPSKETAQLQLEKKARLDSYGWIDKEEGIVHIPIQQAMKYIIDAQQENKKEAQ